MGKAVTIIIGLALIGLGVWGCVNESWQEAVIAFLQGGLVIMALIIGLGIFVFGISDLRAGAQPPSPEPAGESQGEGESR